MVTKSNHPKSLIHAAFLRDWNGHLSRSEINFFMCILQFAWNRKGLCEWTQSILTMFNSIQNLFSHCIQFHSKYKFASIIPTGIPIPGKGYPRILFRRRWHHQQWNGSWIQWFIFGCVDGVRHRRVGQAARKKVSWKNLLLPVCINIWFTKPCHFNIISYLLFCRVFFPYSTYSNLNMSSTAPYLHTLACTRSLTSQTELAIIYAKLETYLYAWTRTRNGAMVSTNSSARALHTLSPPINCSQPDCCNAKCTDAMWNINEAISPNRKKGSVFTIYQMFAAKLRSMIYAQKCQTQGMSSSIGMSRSHLHTFISLMRVCSYSTFALAVNYLSFMPT